MTYAAAIEALADPTRRKVFESLRKGPRSVGDIAGEVPVSRPAVSQHLRVLRDAGLVYDEPQGTKRIYRVDPRGLTELRTYLDSYWKDTLGRFAQHATKKGKGMNDTALAPVRQSVEVPVPISQAFEIFTAE